MTAAVVIVLVLVVVAIASVVAVQRTTGRVSPDDVAWILAARPEEGVPDDEAVVVSRYLRRHQQCRVVGGLLGVVFAAVVGLRWYQSVGFGFGQQSPFADLLFCGVAGVLVGALYAESFRLRPGPGARWASLEPHPSSPSTGIVWAARIMLAASLLGALAMLMTGAGTAALVSAGLGTALVVVAELTRKRIVDRRRMVDTERVDRLDRRMRAFAAAAVANLELAAAALSAMWVAAWWGNTASEGLLLVKGLSTLAWIAGLAVVLVGLYRAAPRAPRRDRLARLARLSS